MSFTHTPTASGATIVMPNRLDSASSSDFRACMQVALSRAPRLLTLECHELVYIDSTGLGLLTLAKGEAERVGCKIALNHVPRPGAVADVLALVHFDSLFPITYLEL